MNYEISEISQVRFRNLIRNEDFDLVAYSSLVGIIVCSSIPKISSYKLLFFLLSKALEENRYRLSKE